MEILVDIESGTSVVVVDADGVEHRMQALSGIEVEGHSFPIVWVERPLNSGGVERMPWPAEAVRPA